MITVKVMTNFRTSKKLISAVMAVAEIFLPGCQPARCVFLRFCPHPAAISGQRPGLNSQDFYPGSLEKEE
jgi:hypothetical protein